ncbi:MAG: 50S ribosomal protein L18 [archaeon]
MAKGPRYAVHFRRRREGKTNYSKRLKMLRARMPRLVVRRSNKYITIQLIEYSPKGDKTLVTAHSSELQSLGWKHCMKNTPAAYLTGLIAARKAHEKKIKTAILDIGLYTPSKGTKLFAALKGAVDGGLEINYGAEVLPDEKRISGHHIAEWLKKPQISSDFVQLKNKLVGKT